MSFAEQLQAAKGDLTARQVAEVLGNSSRTVENWLAGRNTPGGIVQAAALAALQPKKRTSRKSRNAQVEARRQ